MCECTVGVDVGDGPTSPVFITGLMSILPKNFCELKEDQTLLMFDELTLDVSVHVNLHH
jgi:hypothetical protein